MKLPESSEHYLEAILILSKQKEMVIMADVARYFDYSRASVSRAMHRLKDFEMITIRKDGHLSLTPEGLRIASEINRRNQFFKDILLSLGIDEITAEIDACRLEHAISEDSFQAIKDFMSKHLLSEK